jgi:glycosyltransferase involved in cell wall biosynthesis
MNHTSAKKIVFVSTLEFAPWGGSELLWSETAMKLRAAGHTVAASVCRWQPRPAKLQELHRRGVTFNERWFPNVQFRPRSLTTPLIRRATRLGFRRWLHRQKPDLICVSHGSVGEEVGLIQHCAASGFPYAVVIHANGEGMWPDDQRARELLNLYRQARRLFFVSAGNRTLLETQLGTEFPHSEIVRNPFNVRRNAALPWPANSATMQLACVGRLEPMAKGQDLLLRILAREPWRSRPIKVSFFGRGASAEGLQRLARRWQLDGRAAFCGFENDIEKIWAAHHALILPSRFEGLPISIVEAMHCGRPVIATDVAGNGELLRDGVTGFMAEAPTEHHLAAAMERAWASRERWAAMGQAAAREIREQVPADPAAEFAGKLLAIANNTASVAN